MNGGTGNFLLETLILHHSYFILVLGGLTAAKMVKYPLSDDGKNGQIWLSVAIPLHTRRGESLGRIVRLFECSECSNECQNRSDRECQGEAEVMT